MTDYTAAEQVELLILARHTLTAITHQQPTPELDLDTLPPSLAAERACFVTLRRHDDGSLRGCTGTLVARRALAAEVVHMTIQTAFHDPRFSPVQADEIGDLHIEISVLTPPQALEYDAAEDLLTTLRPGIDGVTLQLDQRRATFLPQVWDTYPDPEVFLSLLARKMGHAPQSWRDPRVSVHIYQALVIEE